MDEQHDGSHDGGHGGGDDAGHEHEQEHEHELVTELRQAVAARVTDDAVALRPHDGGFALAWVDPLVHEGLHETTTTRTTVVVRCDPTTLTYVIEDVAATGTVSRHGGRATSVARGRSAGHVTAVYGRRPDGSFGRLGRQEHRPPTLHAAVRAAAAGLGWRERQPASVVVAKVAAGVALGGLAVGGVVVALLALTGALPG